MIPLSETKTTTRGGTTPSFAHNTKEFLHLFWVFRSELNPQKLPSERAKKLRRVQVTIVHISVSYRLCRLPPFFTPRFCVSAALTSMFRPARSWDITYSLAFTVRLIASSPSCHNTCSAGALGTVSHLNRISQPTKLMIKSRPALAKPYTAPLHSLSLSLSLSSGGITRLEHSGIIM